jgi:hypothetical protein
LGGRRRLEENDTMTGSLPWQQARLAALDLEGSGAQDRDNEAILEIAVVPLAEGQPDLPHAYSTLVNPQRPVPRRPWISPGSRPHRALWDAAGTVLLLRKLITMKYPDGVSIHDLMSVAGAVAGTDVTGCGGDAQASAMVQGQLFS